MSRSTVNFDEIWGEVSRPDFVSAAPTNEHDQHSVRGTIALMREIKEAIANAKQGGVSLERVQGLREGAEADEGVFS